MIRSAHSLSRWYTHIIGIFFLLVAISLVFDMYSFGFRPETMHKIFHILVGLVVVIYWNNQKFWRPFALINGSFFSFVAIFGWIFMDFASLDAFNLVDTVLHSIVGVSGIACYFCKTGN